MKTVHSGVYLPGLRSDILSGYIKPGVMTRNNIEARDKKEAVRWIDLLLRKGQEYSSGCLTPEANGECPGRDQGAAASPATRRHMRIEIMHPDGTLCFDGDQDELYGITKEQFREYEELRRSGKTNMWGASRYLGWSPVPVIEHYSEMAAHWLKEGDA